VIEVGALAGSAGDEAWDAFLTQCAGGLVYYSSRYRNLLVEELGCEPEYLVARDGGEIRGVLPLMWSDDAGDRVLNSLPYYGSHGAPLATSSDAERALIEAWNDRAADSRTVAATMVANPFRGADALEPDHNLTDRRISQVTALPDDPDAERILSLVESSARRNVRRAARAGIEVEADPSAWSDLYEIHGANMSAIGGLPKSRRFFDAVTRHLRAGEDFDLWVARLDGEMIAGLLVLHFNRVSEYFTPATRHEHRSDQPLALILVKAMTEAVRKGSRLWNWGGTWSTQDGVYRFKRKWGAKEGDYRYFIRVNDRSLLEASPEELRERFPHFYVAPFSALRSAQVAAGRDGR
jgi:Acetyltransferase (GNAT) domain